MNAREKFAKGLIGVSGDDDGLGPQARNRVRVQCYEDESRGGNSSNLRSMQLTTALADAP
jgi:hypothetical protein